MSREAVNKARDRLTEELCRATSCNEVEATIVAAIKAHGREAYGCPDYDNAISDVLIILGSDGEVFK